MWDIISQVYSLIGKPIDDISTLVNNCDEKVWDIYAKGLTTTINQADSDFAKPLVMKYKPKNLAELSAFVAAIRPAFSSLLNNFLNRLPYSTGVEALDNILNDSFHYLLYQESIMSFLVWLGIEEKGTYDIIKKISKKKFKEDELHELQEKLESGWIKNVGNINGFAETWKVVEDAAHYAFNASHSLSVAIDSLYGAYLKSHYPLEYFTTVLTMYADDMSRTANLISELKYFGIKLESIKFGKSTANYSMDKDTNAIYKGISSVKFCNSIIAEELLELSKSKKYVSFIDLLDDISNKTSVNTKQLKILTGLNFFSDFGNNQYLLQIIDLHSGIKEKSKTILPSFRIASQIKKDKIESYSQYGVTEYIISKYAKKETPKQYSDIDNIGLLNELMSKIPNKAMPIIDYIKFEKEYLEYVTYTNPKISSDYYVVTTFETYKNTAKPHLVLRNINSGEEIKTRIKDSNIYKNNPFGLYSILKIKEFNQDFKSKMINGEWKKSDELETILEKYEIVKE